MGIDLLELNNPLCEQCKNKETRHTDSYGICSKVKSVADEKSVRCIGDWGKSKIYYLTQYFGIFSQGMKNRFAGNLNYIEICSGPGRCICREDGNEIDGTPLAIIKHQYFVNISAAYFVDYSASVVATLNERISTIDSSGKAKAYIGDYKKTDTLDPIVKSINKNGLNLVFIDPTDCSVPFFTVKYLAENLGRVDFLINVAIYTDAARNFSNIVNRNYDRNKYNSFLGCDFFFRQDIIKAVKENNNVEIRNKFKEAYKESLTKIGYEFFDLKKIGNYYDLLYASKNEKGLDFWKKATKYDPYNQKELDLGL